MTGQEDPANRHAQGPRGLMLHPQERGLGLAHAVPRLAILLRIGDAADPTPGATPQCSVGSIPHSAAL